MTDKRLGSTWQVFRLTLRYTAATNTKDLMHRIQQLPLEPTDPERLAPLVHAVFSEIDRDSEAEEKSPVLRAVQKAFRPTEGQKDRRKLKKSFDAYVKAWQAKGGT